MSEDTPHCKLTSIRVDFFAAAGVGIIGRKSRNRRSGDRLLASWCTEKRYE